MALSSQTDEFDLLDSIFDELDAEALSKLGTVQTTVAADSVDVHTKKAKLASQTLRRPSGPTAAAPVPRRALQPISSNGRQQQPQSQTRPGDVKGKGKASDTKPVASKSPSTSRTSGAFRPSSTKTQVANPVSRLSSPAIRTVAQASRPSAHAPVSSTIQDSASQAARKQADAALLHDLDWSDDDQGVDLFASTSKKGKEAVTAKPAIKAKQGGVATKDNQKATAGHLKGPTAAEQSSRLKAEQLANARKQPGYIPVSQRFTRCTVISVTEKILNQFRREKTAIVEIDACKSLRCVKLFDEWATTDLEEGDTVNVIGDFISPPPVPDVGPTAIADDGAQNLPTCILSYASSNLLILHPDTLLSATRVSDAPICRRKAVVQEKLRSSAGLTPALVYGHLLHELLQACLLAMSTYKLPLDADEEDEREAIDKAFGPNKRSQEIKKLLSLSKNVEQLFMLGIELDEARSHLSQKSLGFAEFAERFIGKQVKPESYLSDPRNKDLDPATSTRLAIAGVHDIEEDIWSPRLGLKGKVDASVQGTLQGPPSVFWPCGKEDAGVLPFEIKTGRSAGILQHRAQTMLYTQMMADRYDREIEAGLLYYTQTNTVIRIEPAKNELRGLIIARNEMARYLTHGKQEYVPNNEDESFSLPPPPTAHDAVSSPARTDVNMDVDPEVDPEDTALSQSRPKLAAVKSEEEEDAELWDEVDDSGSLPPSQAPKPTRPVLPAAIDELRSCKNCYAAEGCMLYRRAVDKVSYLPVDDGQDGEALQEIYDDRVGHLTDEQCEFFEKWERLITLEEREMVRFKKEIWTMTAHERQRHGRCLADMVIDTDFAGAGIQPESDKPGAYRFKYRLVRSGNPPPPPQTQFGTAPPASQAAAAQSLTGGQLSVGDPVVVSIEPSVLALARGYVLGIQTEFIDLGLDHSITALPGDACDGFAPTSGQILGNIVYRIDKDELQSGMGKIRDNLAQLFYAKGDEKRRRLVVDLEKPRFRPLELADERAAESKHLNADQKEAVNKVLTARDYALILGMPGTGKTTTVAEIIKALVAQGKSILLTSYTHSAVDNILAKVQDLEEVKMLRLGNPDKVMPSLAHLTLAGLPPPASMAELEDRYLSPQIVATTALSVDHPLFSRRIFDYCIVDEASQITLPTCLGPLRFAETFILVGDHNQLPPLVKSPSARLDGLEVSLFRRLSEAHPSAVVYLTHQYRMNEDIMTLSNNLVYHGKLKCGSPNLADQSLALPRADQQEILPRWLKDLVCPSRKVVFVDTDALPARESKSGRLVQNDLEAKLLHRTAEALLACGVKEDQIGVITLYKQQVKLLTEGFKYHQDIEILTADKSQGRDKDCILMSLVRSNAEKKVGDLLKDWRRLNVCFTRAKQKLVIFGSRSTLNAIPLLARFFELLEEKSWIYALPSDVKPVMGALYVGTTSSNRLSLAGHKPKLLHGAGSQTIAPASKRCSDLSRAESSDKRIKLVHTRSTHSTARKADHGILNNRPILRDVVASQ